MPVKINNATIVLKVKVDWLYGDRYMIKLIAFDLDGTLANRGVGITDENIGRLKRLEENGIKIAICSGKTVDYLGGFMRQVGLTDVILLGENGAVFQMGVEWPPKEQKLFPYSKQAKESLAMIREEIDGRLPGLWYQPNLVGVSPFPRCEEEFEIISDILEKKAEQLQGIKVYRHVDCYDIVPAAIDKKSGLHFLAQELGLKPEEIVAVGDGENDYPMFEYAGLALGVQVKDETQVDKNFDEITDVFEYLDAKLKQVANLEDDWATQAMEELEDFIESQGIYIRQ